jgi:hypothetical protein
MLSRDQWIGAFNPLLVADARRAVMGERGRPYEFEVQTR